MVLRQAVSRIVAEGMLRENTPIEHYPEFNLYVKREDLACFPPGPRFSKTRGVYAHVKSRPEQLIGVLDTAHSQAGHAVARACQILGKKCINFYPMFKNSPEPKPPQLAAKELGAEIVGLPAGRSAILYHAAKKQSEARGAYIMPNALKLEESVAETAKEVPNHYFDRVLLPVSSGTIAAGVIRGFHSFAIHPTYLIHLGYSRSIDATICYLEEASGVKDFRRVIIDEKYAYKDKAVAGETPPWPCNPYYDLKAFRWIRRQMEQHERFTDGNTLLWNIG